MRRLASLAVLGCVLTASAAAPSGHTERIPEVHVASLAGQKVDLPEMLQGRSGVLVLGFSRDSRAQVTAWGKRLATDFNDSHDVLYFEMPMLASVPRLLRGMVLKSIRSEVSERAQPHFAPLTADEPRWKALAGYSQTDDAYVLVVDGNGTVTARAQGEASDAAYNQVKQRVESLRPHPRP